MTDPMTPERMAEIEARANAATPGPWEAWDRGIGFEVHVNGEELNSEFRETFRQADAEFIAEARTDVPALLAEVRRLQAAVERVRELHVPDGEGFCRACDYGTQHPCPTIAALDGDEQ